MTIMRTKDAPTISPEALAKAQAIDWTRIDDALISCAGLLKALCRDNIGDTAASELEYARSVIAALQNVEAERDHFRERFFLASAALTPVSEDEKRGMLRVLAILESKKKSGTGPVRGQFGEKWVGRVQAFTECAEMLRLATDHPSLNKERQP